MNINKRIIYCLFLTLDSYSKKLNTLVDIMCYVSGIGIFSYYFYNKNKNKNKNPNNPNIVYLKNYCNKTSFKKEIISKEASKRQQVEVERKRKEDFKNELKLFREENLKVSTELESRLEGIARKKEIERMDKILEQIIDEEVKKCIDQKINEQLLIEEQKIYDKGEQVYINNLIREFNNISFISEEEKEQSFKALEYMVNIYREIKTHKMTENEIDIYLKDELKKINLTTI